MGFIRKLFCAPARPPRKSSTVRLASALAMGGLLFGSTMSAVRAHASGSTTNCTVSYGYSIGSGMQNHASYACDNLMPYMSVDLSVFDDTTDDGVAYDGPNSCYSCFSPTGAQTSDLTAVPTREYTMEVGTTAEAPPPQVWLDFDTNSCSTDATQTYLTCVYQYTYYYVTKPNPNLAIQSAVSGVPSP